MPEGPEIRREADRIGAALQGEALRRVRFTPPALRRWGPRLKGVRVEEVTSRGKALLVHFRDGPVLYAHNQLYGRWTVCPAGRPPETRRTLRVALEGRDHWALLYSASEIELLHPDELDDHGYLSRLGPDLLDVRTTPARIRRRLLNARFANRFLGSLLLDQGFLAGVGNYLRSEILFFAGVRPECRPADLDDEGRARLAAAARTVTRRSYRTGGLTEEPRFVAAARRAGERRRSYRHAVFSRLGRPCRRCGTRIRKVTSAGRRLYLCHVCQSRPARSGRP